MLRIFFIVGKFNQSITSLKWSQNNFLSNWIKNTTYNTDLIHEFVLVELQEWSIFVYRDASRFTSRLSRYSRTPVRTKAEIREYWTGLTRIIVQWEFWHYWRLWWIIGCRFCLHQFFINRFKAIFTAFCRLVNNVFNNIEWLSLWQKFTVGVFELETITGWCWIYRSRTGGDRRRAKELVGEFNGRNKVHITQ